MPYQFNMNEKYIRDENSKAIINTDTDGLIAYKKRKKISLEKMSDINIIKEQIKILIEKVQNLEDKLNGNS